MPYRTPSNLLGLTDRRVPEGYFWLTFLALWVISALYHVALTGGISYFGYLFVTATAAVYVGLVMFVFAAVEVVFEVGRKTAKRLA